MSVEYKAYEGERDLPIMMDLIGRDLSEPYSIYTYRYFLNGWPNLSFLATIEDQVVGVIVCKVDERKISIMEQIKDENKDKKETTYDRGYIGMLAVDKQYRKRGIGVSLVHKSIEAMRLAGCKEVVLETEASNLAAIHLYSKCGFIRDKRLEKYYLSGSDAYRLKLTLET